MSGNLCDLEEAKRLVRRGIAAGKTQRGLRTQPAAMLRSVCRPTQTFFQKRQVWVLSAMSTLAGCLSAVILTFVVLAVDDRSVDDVRRSTPVLLNLFRVDVVRRRRTQALARNDLVYFRFRLGVSFSGSFYDVVGVRRSRQRRSIRHVGPAIY